MFLSDVTSKMNGNTIGPLLCKRKQSKKDLGKGQAKDNQIPCIEIFFRQPFENAFRMDKSHTSGPFSDSRKIFRGSFPPSLCGKGSFYLTVSIFLSFILSTFHAFSS